MRLDQNRSQDALPESASVLLDFVRFGAAILVVIAHITHPEFSLGYVNRQILGDIAVPVFFVLSGFVIRFVTRSRESTAREYFIDRSSRMYSVVLPALLFTAIVGAVCFAIDHVRFSHGWADTFNHPIERLVLNLLFVSQAWGHNTIPGVDAPFWSLGYECVYYLFYGFFLFFRGRKRVILCAALAAIIGPQVLFLLPVWWLGCWLYDFYRHYRGTRVADALLIVSAAWLSCGAVLRLAGYRALLHAPIAVFWWIVRLPNPIAMVGMQPVRATMFAVASGVLSAVALLPLLFAMDYWRISRENRWARSFRQIANGTFVIYLMHYPFLVLLLFMGLLSPQRPVGNVLVGVGMCAVLIVVAVPIDSFKMVIRRWLRRVCPGGGQGTGRVCEVALKTV